MWYQLLAAFAYSASGDMKRARVALQAAKGLEPKLNDVIARTKQESRSMYDYLSRVENLSR
jgi:hypothetical protein